MDALCSRDFENIKAGRLPYSNYSYTKITAWVPKAERERILAILKSESDARWYWIWVKRGLEPEKALRKVQVDIASQRRELNKKRVEWAMANVVYL